MSPRVLLSDKKIEIILKRLASQLIEKFIDFDEVVLVGLQPRGIHLLDRLVKLLENDYHIQKVIYGKLDITFFRDDFRRKEKPLVPSITNIDFSIENKIVVLVDDVFFTGRTVRSGLDAIMTFGRPLSVEFLTLVERRFTQHLPIKADYIGQSIDTINEEKVSVLWKENDGEDQIILHTPENE